jgi:UDP-N-acetylmuramoyl-L-alanyl-D-glutamate--2,6-diaminopimelate ligase
VRLDRLVDEAGLAGRSGTQLIGDGGIDVGPVVMDSRRVTPGCLFACVPGARTDGHDFAAAAAADGAVALLCERPLEVDLPQVIVSSVRVALGPLCHIAYGRPSEHLHVVAVTGTNGKTTTVAFLRSILETNGWPATMIGTLTQNRTTPEAPDLHSLLAAWRADGGLAAAMEVSSHALEQHRTDSVRFEAGVFTNLSPEHLDYHHDMGSYFEAKARLFEPGRVAAAVVCTDDEWGVRLAGRLQGQNLLTYSLLDASEVEMTPSGTRFTWRGRRVSISLGGEFNVANALAAATCARAIGISDDVVVRGLGEVRSVPGRFELVDAGQDFAVVVDYAHTPDGLAKVLQAARGICAGRLIAVFGAGGDRDKEKRALMGAAASRLADLVLVTSDNPRSEDPEAIITQILAGADGRDHVRPVSDRSVAISAAVTAARTGDVIVIAGKGHEKGQEIAGRVLPFDDVDVARQAIERVLSARSWGAQ